MKSIPWSNENSKIKKVIIKNGVQSIGYSAFYGCSGLTSIDIPESVTTIGESAFFACYSLTSINIPESVTSIGKNAFYGCSGLTSFSIPKKVNAIENAVFFDCSGLTSINIPNSVTSIGEGAFLGCSNLTSIIIPESVTSIGRAVFSGCSGLTSVNIPNSVTSIVESAFSGCSGLTSVTIPNSVTSIGDWAFFGCSGLTSIIIPKYVTSIGSSAFSGCSGLTSITIPNSVVNIGNSAFEGCTSLRAIYLPESLTNIGDKAFYGCSYLTSITIPQSITNIGNSAFYNCYGLTSVIIPKSVTSIGASAFYGCSGLSTIDIPSSVKSIGHSAFYHCSGLTSITIPNSITSIEDRTFYYCSALTSIKIPESVTSIGKASFQYCLSLTSITIPESVTSIGELAFNYCAKLTSINIPKSITNIGQGTFQKCIKLRSVTIPESVTIIGKSAFSGCSGLTSFTCEATVPPNCGSNCFVSVNKSIPLYVPINSIDAFKKASQWKEFTNIQEIPDNQKIADAVVAMINAIGKVEYTDACKGKIDAANKAYSALTADQKALVTNLDVLTKAQQTYETLKAAAEKLAADKAKADPVITKINAIGKVEYTDACKNKIDAANTAYNALTADQKALVTNLDVLTAAQQTYDNLKAAADKLAADKAKANPVIAKINAIGKVEYTDACKGKIDEANNAYNALTADQKALVTNLDVLTAAQQTYDNLKAAADKLAADKAKADPVIAKINAIGKVEYTDACKNKIDEANNAYNALTADQKALVSNLDVLTTAQQTYESLKAAAEKLAADKSAFDKYKSEQKAIIETLVKEDDSDAVKEIIKKAISDIDALEYEEALSLDDNKVNINSFVTSVNEAVEKQRAEDEKTTSIDELEFTEKVNIYDLNGKKITNSMLKSGLYIRNGKKVVVK